MPLEDPPMLFKYFVSVWVPVGLCAGRLVSMKLGTGMECVCVNWPQHVLVSNGRLLKPLRCLEGGDTCVLEYRDKSSKLSILKSILDGWRSWVAHAQSRSASWPPTKFRLANGCWSMQVWQSVFWKRMRRFNSCNSSRN